MLAFDDHFVADEPFQVCLWAEHQSRSRIRFEIGPDVLSEVLGGANPVHDDDNDDSYEGYEEYEADYDDGYDDGDDEFGDDR